MRVIENSARLWILACVALAVVVCFAATGRADDQPADSKQEATKQSDNQADKEKAKEEKQKAKEEKKKKAEEKRKARQEAMEKVIEAARKAAEEEQKALDEKLRSDPAWQTTHQQTAVIKAGPESKPVAMNNFCLNLDGNLLVACGGKRVEYVEGKKPGEFKTKKIDEPAEIRVLRPDGKLLKAWSLEFKPQVLCVAADGTIYAAGDGRLAKLDQQGKVLATADSPALTPDKPAPKKKDKDEKKDGEKKDEKKSSVLGALLKSLVPGSSLLQQDEEGAAASAEQRKDITGIAVTKDDLFLVTDRCAKATATASGGWIATSRSPRRSSMAWRGCCGQMDIQAQERRGLGCPQRPAQSRTLRPRRQEGL